MPQNSSRAGKSSNPPEVMTWRGASLVLILAGLFDVIRAFFQFFWFFGPALATIYCANKAAGILSTWTLGILGAKTAATLCAGAGVAAGAAAIAFTAPTGVIMADAVGLIGFLTLGLIIIMTNARILKTVSAAPLQFAGAFAVGEVPFLGALPVFSITLWKLYRTQIQAEKASLAAWKKTRAAQEAEQGREKAAELTQARVSQEAQVVDNAEQQAAANEEMFAAQEEQEATHAGRGTEAANDDAYREQING